MERILSRIGIRNKEVRLSLWGDTFSNEVLSPSKPDCVHTAVTFPEGKGAIGLLAGQVLLRAAAI
jgi:hypothetical protein